MDDAIRTVAVAPDAYGVLARDGSVAEHHGSALPQEAVTELAQMRGVRPAARKFGSGVLCLAPMLDGRSLFHHFANTPENTGVATLLARIEKQAATVAKPKTDAPSTAAKLIEAAHQASKLRKRYRLDWFATEIADLTGAKMATLVRVQNGKPRKIWFGALRDARARQDEIRHHLKQRLASKGEADPSLQRVRSDDTTPEALDAALLGKAFDGATLATALPADRIRGYALVLAGSDAPDWLEQVPALTEMLVPTQSKKTKGLSRLIAFGAIAAAAIWLALPAPLVLTTQGQAVPIRAETIALPFGSFVDAVHVRAGDLVTQGAPIADMLEPDIAAQLSEQEIAQALEQINASAALDEGDYATYQLAENRSEIAQLRIEQLSERLSMLAVRAPFAGTVVDAILVGERGQFLPAGTSIARIQPDRAYDVVLDLPPTDAPLIQAGQTGSIRFRGVSGDVFASEIIGVPEQVIDPQTNAARLVVRARLIDGPQDRLLVGLSGAARIEVGEAPRIYGWLRPAISYARDFGWRFFGLQS